MTPTETEAALDAAALSYLAVLHDRTAPVRATLMVLLERTIRRLEAQLEKAA